MYSSEEKYYQSFIENLTLINSHDGVRGTGSLFVNQYFANSFNFDLSF